MKTSKWIQIGSFGVDSGQVLITDPCYVKDFESNELVDKRVYIDKKTGKEYILRVNFENFENIIRDNKTMNQLIADGEIEEKIGHLDDSYSYAGACDTTLHTELNAGTIGYGADGVVASTGYGDGVYPVYARYEDGRIKEIKIVFF